MIFRSGNTLIYDTGQSPKGFKGVVAVCKEGTEPGNVKEAVHPVDNLKKMETVESTTLTPEWRAAFGLPEPKPPKKERPTPAKRKPGSARNRKPPRRRETVVVEEQCSYATWRRDYKRTMQDLFPDMAVGVVILPITLVPMVMLSLLACVNLFNDWFLGGKCDE